MITPERLGVLPVAGIIDLEQDSQLSIIELSDDTAPLSGLAVSSDSSRATGNHQPIIKPSVDIELLFDIGLTEQDEVDEDVLVWIAAQKTKDKKVSYEATRHFQSTWAAKLPWAECIKGPDGFYNFVKCVICRYSNFYDLVDVFLFPALIYVFECMLISC